MWPAEEARRSRRKEAGWRSQVGPHEAEAAFLLGEVAETPDITLVELQEKLKVRGVSAGIGTLWRFFDRRRITLQKKTAHAAEQQRGDVKAAREAWFEGQLDLDPERLIFIDETSASTKMARLYGRAPKESAALLRFPWPLEDDDLHGWAADRRSRGAFCARRPDGW